MLAQLSNVTKTYGSKEGVSDLSFGLEAGYVVGLLGLNGSGKTTLMKLISGLLKPTAGTVEVRGQSPRRSRQTVAFLGDKVGFPSWMKPGQIAGMMGSFYCDFSQEVFNQALESLEVPLRPIGTMSKGQQQKLRLAATMARRTSLYLLDEPLSGIDIVARHSILESLMQFWDQKTTVVITTHEIKDVEPFLNRALLLKTGRLVDDLDVAELRESGGTVADRFLSIMGGKAE